MTSLTRHGLHVVHTRATGFSAAASADPTGPTTTGPRFDDTVPLHANAVALAGWLWGDLRAEWCGALADDVARARPLARYAPASQEWVAAILCAAAVDAGRNQRASTWARTLRSIAAVTDLPRETVVARWTELTAIGLSRPSDLPGYWRRSASSVG